MSQMHNEERQLDELWARYRWACPEPEATAQFLPGIWNRIEGRRTFLWTFGRLGRSMAAASLAIVLGLACLNLAVSSTPQLPSYPDALLSDPAVEVPLFAETAQATAAVDEHTPATASAPR